MDVLFATPPAPASFVNSATNHQAPRLTRMVEAGGIGDGGGATSAEEMDSANSGGRIRQQVQ
jgi:hypothetical protein